MPRSRRPLLVFVLLAALALAPALAAAAAPARAAAAPSWLATLLDWLPEAIAGAGRATAAEETLPNADPNGAAAQPLPGSPLDSAAGTSPGTGGEALPNADPNG